MSYCVSFQIVRAYDFEVLGGDPYTVGRRELPHVEPDQEEPLQEPHGPQHPLEDNVDAPQPAEHNGEDRVQDIDPPVDDAMDVDIEGRPAIPNIAPDPVAVPPVQNEGNVYTGYHHLTDPLYDGSTMTSGNFCLRMTKIKTDHNVSEVAMNELYKLISKGMPVGNVVPSSSYAAAQTLGPVGLQYESIHAC